MKRLAVAIAISLTGIVVTATPSEAGPCWQCNQDTCFGSFESGYWTCTQDPLLGCMPFDRCRIPALGEYTGDVHVLADGAVIKGKQISEDAFAVRTCSGTQIEVVYSGHGEANRLQVARVITLE